MIFRQHNIYLLQFNHFLYFSFYTTQDGGQQKATMQDKKAHQYACKVPFPSIIANLL